MGKADSAGAPKRRPAVPSEALDNTGPAGCERYVECVCDVAIEVRHRGGDNSYMVSCDAARLMADLGTSEADCEQALVDMQPWFDGIAAVYPRVEIPSLCR